MRRPFDCVVGLRDANHGSGVGLFNQQLARRLGVPYRRLEEACAPAAALRSPPARRPTTMGRRASAIALECNVATVTARPLLSFKFEELSRRERQRLDAWRRGPNRGAYGVFLHTLDHSPLETSVLQDAQAIYCGNEAIARVLGERPLAAPLVRAFAPSLIQAGLGRPAPIEFFYFGMASKIDRERFVRLRHLLGDLASQCRLLCSLSVHQTSDGTCLAKACEFFRGLFGDRFLFLGTLTDEGLAYFMSGQRIFLGFYRQGVRANNTTFNTALRFGMRILTNLDEDSPGELRGDPAILDLDKASKTALRRFLRSKAKGVQRALADRFSWERLVATLDELPTQPARRVA